MPPLKILRLLLALTLACPAGALAEPSPKTTREALALAFREGRPLDQLPGNGIDAAALRAREDARAVQDGPKAGENQAVFSERVRAAARGLHLTDAGVEDAVRLYCAQRGGASAGARPETGATLDSVRRAKRINANAQDLARGLAAGPSDDGLSGPGAPSGAGMTAEDLRRLNALPSAQAPLIRHLTGSVAAPATTPETLSWSAGQQAAGSRSLLAAQAVPDDGSLTNWGRKRWLMARGVGQFLAGKASDGETWKAAGKGAQDLGSYPGYAWSAAKAVGRGFVEDFKNVHTDGKALMSAPSASKAADLSLSASLVLVNFVGMGLPGVLKTGAKTAATAVAKEGVEVALKEAGTVAVEAGAKAAAAEGVEAAAKAAGRAEWRAANRAVIEENLAVAGSAERAAAVRAQMPALKEPQVKAVLEAHAAFPCAGVGCTHADLRGKYEVLAKAGMSPEQIRETLDRGLAGNWFSDLLAPANKVIGQGTGAMEGVTLTVNGERLAARLKRQAVATAIPLKEVRQAGMLLYPSQNIASSRVVAEYAELMKAGKWDWSRGARIELGTGKGGETVVLEGHHRVLAAQQAGVKIPASAFARTRKTAVPFDWAKIGWSRTN